MVELVGLAGDWHGNILHACSTLGRFDFLEIKHIFQLGDFGLYGSLLENGGDKYRYRINDLLERNDQWLYVTLGNHENYDLLKKIPVVTEGEHAGFQREDKAPRILYFTRGQGMVLGGRNFLSLGGAASIDYTWRVEYEKLLGAPKSWWIEERISMEDVRKTLETASNMGHVDVLLAHDVFASAPILGTHRQDKSKWSHDELTYAQTSRDTLEKVAQVVRPTLWAHGHYHKHIETVISFPRATIGKKGKTVQEKDYVRTYCLGGDKADESMAVLDLRDLSVTYF